MDKFKNLALIVLGGSIVIFLVSATLRLTIEVWK